MHKVLTMEVDGVPLAVEVADEFNVNVAIAKSEKDQDIEDFYEQRVVYSPDSMKYLYLAKNSIKKGEHVLIVDDFIQSGITIDALVKLVGEGQGEGGRDIHHSLHGAVPAQAQGAAEPQLPR